MVLLAAEERMSAEQGSPRRSSAQPRRRGTSLAKALHLAEGVEGLRDVPHPGAPPKVTEEYRELLVHALRRRALTLGSAFWVWTLRRLADYMAENRAASGWSMKPFDYTSEGRGDRLEPPPAYHHEPGLSEYALNKRRSKRPATTSAERQRSSTMPTSSTSELDAHPQSDVEPEGPAGDDPDTYLPTYSPWLNPIEMLWRHFSGVS